MDKEEWIVSTSNSDCEGIELYKFYGTETEVREMLVEMVKEDSIEDRDRFECGTETTGEVVREYDGSFSAYGLYYYYRIDYVAQRVCDISIIE